MKKLKEKNKSISIRNRVEDALFLWENGRKEGALLSVLVAIASTARRVFPDRKSVNDSQAFERFLGQTYSMKLRVEYRGELHTIEHIFYQWLRCELVHEGGIPPDIEFIPDKENEGLSLRAGGKPNNVLILGENWFHFLIKIVVQAPINVDQFADN